MVFYTILSVLLFALAPKAGQFMPIAYMVSGIFLAEAAKKAVKIKWLE